ncbi:MAG: DegT/DnrJ/EryC1/StrS family aminotransferase [Patescibacteria group bacterium]|nr:DegT/DnrJ/EryC1/StrS family aminotransferase [Patescibacteria group bacterium]
MKYKVRFVNPQKQYKDHKKEFLKTIDDVFSRGDLISRGDLENFEKKIAKFVGVKYAIGVNSGTDALTLSMQAAGINRGDEVITVGHTFMASISSIYHQGAKAVLVDVGKDFNMNSDLIEKAITSKTVAIEPVHLNGRVCDMDKIIAIAEKNNLSIIEDAAQALGAKYKTKEGKWKMAGSFGLAGCFSMYPFKMLGGFGDAGMVVTNNSEIAKKIKLLRFNGESREDRKFYYHGYTALLDNVQAALLNVKFKYFKQWITRRRQIANIYRNNLKDLLNIELPYYGDSRFFDVYQNYVIRAERRNELVKYLNKRGVEVLISWDTPNYKQPVMCPNKIFLCETEKICKEVISLPMYPELNNTEVTYVANCIIDFYKK